MSKQFRVFHRVPGPTTKPDEMFIPQYFEGGAWRGFTVDGGKPVTFSREVEAHQYLIEFARTSIDKITSRINRMYSEREALEQNLKDLMKESIAVNARN